MSSLICRQRSEHQFVGNKCKGGAAFFAVEIGSQAFYPDCPGSKNLNPGIINGLFLDRYVKIARQKTKDETIYCHLIFFIHLHRKTERSLAQLVARYVRDVEVAGSNPVTPTSSAKRSGFFCGRTFLAIKPVQSVFERN